MTPHQPPQKIVKVTDDNMFKLAGDISDLKNKSYYNQRLMKVKVEPKKDRNAADSSKRTRIA